MRVSLLALVALFSVLGFAAPVLAAPAPLALLTSVGRGSDKAQRDVDNALRQALLDEETVDLLAPVETRQHVMSLAEMGLVCLPEDVPCLVKLGIVANVAWVLVPVVEDVPGGDVELQLDLIDVAAAQRARSVKARLPPSDGAGIGSLARRALGLPAEGGTGTGTGTGSGTGGGAAAAGPPLGVIVAGAGGAVAGLSLAGAVVCDLVYTDALDVADATTRKNVVQPLGAALWVTSAVGAIVLGVGTYLILSTPDDPWGAEGAPAR